MRTEPQDDLYKLLEENLEVSKKILRNTEKTRRTMLLQSIASWVRTAIWAVPVILALIYVPRLVGNLEQRLNQTVGPGSASLFEQFFKNINPNDLQKAVEQFKAQSGQK